MNALTKETARETDIDKDYIPAKETGADLLIELLRSGQFDLFDELFKPTKERLEGLSSSYVAAKNFKGMKNGKIDTTKKGELFNRVVFELLSCVPCFYVSEKGRTATNQYDVTVTWDWIFPYSNLFSRLHDGMICECKNEKKSPKNDYFGKMFTSMVISSVNIGIIFSIQKSPETYTDMAREIFYQSDKTRFIITFFDDDLKAVFSGANLLKLIEAKMNEVKKGLLESWYNEFLAKHTPMM